MHSKEMGSDKALLAPFPDIHVSLTWREIPLKESNLPFEVLQQDYGLWITT